MVALRVLHEAFLERDGVSNGQREDSATILLLLDEIDRLSWSGVHTCHANCQKVPCVLRRERDAWKLKAEELSVRLKAVEKEIDKAFKRDFTNNNPAIRELSQALTALYLVVDESVADDVGRKVAAAFESTRPGDLTV